MERTTALLRKLLISAICFISIISIGLNIYQYTKWISEKNCNLKMSRDFMNMHETTFNNSFYKFGNNDIMEYIESPENLNIIIEGISLSYSYYLAASKYDIKTRSTIQTQTLINQYLTELRRYRIYLEGNHNGSYEDIDQIKITINDLQTVKRWLNIKYSNNDFDVYSDKDFFNEVYEKLNNPNKAAYFLVN